MSIGDALKAFKTKHFVLVIERRHSSVGTIVVRNAKSAGSKTGLKLWYAYLYV